MVILNSMDILKKLSQIEKEIQFYEKYLKEDLTSHNQEESLRKILKSIVEEEN